MTIPITLKLFNIITPPPEKFTLKLLIDISGSMKEPNNSNNPNDKRSRLDVAKEQLPKFIDQLFAHLSIGQTVDVKLIAFNDDEYVTTYTFKKENEGIVDTITLTKKINSLSPLLGTNLNIVTKHIPGERGILICCTDGLQSENNGTFRVDLDPMQPFLETYVLSVAPNETDNYFFEKIKTIGAYIQTAQNVDILFQEILKKIPQMAIGLEAYQLLRKTLLVSTVRIPRQIGIYDTGQQAQNGDSIKHVQSGTETQIQQVHVIPLPNNHSQKNETSTHNQTTNTRSIGSWFSALLPQAQNWPISTWFSNAKKKIIV